MTPKRHPVPPKLRFGIDRKHPKNTVQLTSGGKFAWMSKGNMNKMMSNFNFLTRRHPVIFSDDDWGVKSPPQHNIYVPLPFSEGDWMPRA